jgi:restriction endonuclease S subunit
MYLLKYKWLLTKMNPDKGYIYVRRSHISHDIDGVCKLGKTQNIPERDTQYATGELKRGYFEDVYEVPKERVGIIEKTLQSEFSELNVKYGNKEGLYPFFKSSIKVDSYVDEPDYEEESLIIGDGGEANINYGIKFSTSDHCYILQNKNKLVLNLKYSYYYLFHNLIIMKQLYTGVGIKNISKSSIDGIKIPIPSLRQQERIVKYLDFIYEKSIKTLNEKIADLKIANEFYLNNQESSRGNEMKSLGSICEINPENMKTCQYTEINYIDIASVKGGQILELQQLTSEFPSRAKRIIKKGDILYSSVRPNLKGYVYIDDNIQNCIASTGFAVIRTKDPNRILSKYLYYIMTSEYITDHLISKATGAQYPAVSFDYFETIEIPIPSLKRQREIVEYCENNDRLIQELKAEIETNKREAQRFIKSVVKLDTDDDDDINDNITCEEEKDDEEQADENEYDDEEDDDEEDDDEEDDEEEDVNSLITNFKFTSDKISSDLNEIVTGFTQNLMKLVMDNYRHNQTINEPIPPTTELQNEVEYDDDE